MNIICFHSPDEKNGYLSNWYKSNFIINGMEFSSMEKFMMYSKAVCFSDDVIAKRILKIDDVAWIKELGRQVFGYNDNVWNGMRQIIIYEGLYAKFSQNDILKERLKETKDAILAECAVQDRIWGIGLSMKDPKRFDMTQWKGQNLLGYTLMMVRDKI